VNVVSVAVTEAGRRMAARLPYEVVDAPAGEAFRSRWQEVDGFVAFLATGATVRIVAPLLRDKRTDPAVVCVDEAGRYAIALVGAHEGGGNDLARRVADLIGAEPVVTTASDAVHGTGPPSLVLGVGTSSDAPAEEVAALVEATLLEADLAPESVATVATIDRRRHHPAIVGLGRPVQVFTAGQLAAVAVPSPSAAVEDAVGTPSVCEAAALLAAGPGAELVVAKRKNAVATVAVARRPRGRLWLVGLGPGAIEHRTPAATTAVRHAEVVVGYGPYVDQCADLLRPHHVVVRSPIGEEVSRARTAIEHASAGRRVALVCSGDAGVYAMASIVLELEPDLDVEVVPGVTAALAAAARLGAPLGHDHAAVSLSDLLTPWEAIERRLRAAAEADFVVSLYNPRSKGRSWQLMAARDILLERRPPTTPVGVVGDVSRPQERVELTTLAELDVEAVGMTTCVVVGSSVTRVVGGRMVTPRGYVP
jgi:cobalt-precorrin 5A hydrolase/precorrin-3B C17-methyltransferase